MPYNMNQHHPQQPALLSVFTSNITIIVCPVNFS